MNEQRRIFITMALCFGIFWAWQSIFPPPAPPDLESPASSMTTIAPELVPQPSDLVVTNKASQVGATQAPLVQQVIETAHLRGVLENGTGGLAQLDLKDFQERQKDGQELPEPISLVAKGFRQSEVHWISEADAAPFLNFVSKSPAILSSEPNAGLRYKITITPDDDAFSFSYVLSIENLSTLPRRVGAEVQLALTQQGETKKGWFSAEGDQLRAVYNAEDKVRRQTLEQVEKKPFAGSRASWIAIDRQYFVTGIIAKTVDGGASCRTFREGQTLRVAYRFSEESLAPGKTWHRAFTLYAGPKHAHRLAQIAPQLDAEENAVASQFDRVIDYSFAMIPLGFLARPMVWLLGQLHHLTNSWGLAIILLTITVKAILFPVTYKSAVSMRKMQEMKPELDRLRALYKEDPEKQQAAQLKAYKDNGVSPAGGCLPMLLQIPVWATLYRTLWSSVDLYQQPFLWLQDLTTKEPFPFLALAVGAVTVLQQKLMPQTADNDQMKIMMIVMPLVLTGFMVALPSGLVLYVLVNSVLTIIQQLAINRRTRLA